MALKIKRKLFERIIISTSDPALACKKCCFSIDGYCKFPESVSVQEPEYSCLWKGTYYYFKELKLKEMLSKL